ncbi:MAG: hypothetical protein Q9227_007007 [Pyrenula ochraceoflavens]
MRLIRVDPNLSNDGRIRCSLVHGKICRKGGDPSSNQTYYALSYEWGTKHDLLEIEVNGCRLSVRQNLWRYLDMARQTPKLCTTALWVDAICINQDNIQERNEQVAVMGEIYAGAERVVVWLGSGNAVLEKTIEFLDHCHSSPADQNLTWIFENMDDEYSPAKVKAHSAFLEGLARDRFGLTGSLSDLFDQIVNLTYWTRAWVAQELFHARCTWAGLSIDCDISKFVTFHYGKQSTNFECLRSSAAAIEQFLRPTDSRFWRFRSFTEYMNMLNGVTPKLDLHNSFRIFNDWPASSTDPRDLIYALRSMFVGGEDLQVEYGESLDLLLLRMFVQLKHSHFRKHDRNWLDYSEVRSVIGIASRFNMSMIDFRTLILDAIDKVKIADLCALSLSLKRQYEEALTLLNTGVVHCQCSIATLPRIMLFSSSDQCSGCKTFHPVPPGSPRNMRNCSHCNIEILPWDMVLSSSVPCETCAGSLLVPPAFPSSARYSCAPATGINTHFWLAHVDSGHERGQNLHVLDLSLAFGPWRIQCSLPSVRMETIKDWEHLKVDLKTWLLICVLEDIQRQYLLGDSDDHTPCLPDFIREIDRIARPRLKDEALPLAGLSFWFMSTSKPGCLFTLDEFEAQLT